MRLLADAYVGDDLPSLARVVTREDVRAYAEAGGDANPLHQDDDVARAAGFPGIIAHGMFTMGHLAACIVAWSGDPADVLSLSAHFRAPVFMGDTIVAGGRVTEVNPVDRTAAIDAWVSVERDGGDEQAVRKGRAIVQLR